MTFAIAFSGAASSAIPRPPTPAGKTLEAGHPHIGEADTHQEHHDHHGQSLVTEYWFSVRVLSPTAWRRYCSFAKIILAPSEHSQSRSLITWRPKYFWKIF